jgi:protein gp37
MADTRIDWADKFWNPVRGCSPVSEGCRNCYAMRQAHRFSGPGQPYEGLTHAVPGNGPKWTGEVRCVPELLDAPLEWRRSQRVFVNSMSDLFHSDVPMEFILRVWKTMAESPRHTYQILTKRPDHMAHLLTHWMRPALSISLVRHTWPFPNVWLGVSVEDQANADYRIPLLLRTPAAVRFVSCEPLLGPVDLARAAWGAGEPPPPLSVQAAQCDSALDGLDWVIVGGESGPGARPCNVGWVRSIVRQCRDAGVPVFVKPIERGFMPREWEPLLDRVQAAARDYVKGKREQGDLFAGASRMLEQSVPA